MSRSEAQPEASTPVNSGGPTKDRDRRILGVPVTVAIVALLVARLAVVAIVATRPEAMVDEGIARYERVATSPVQPYRYFAIEWMPLQTGLVVLIGGDGAAATAARIAVIAFVADAAVAAALAYAWGRRHAAVALIVGLPLVVVSYARLDLVAVALAAWAFALARRRRDGRAGLALGLGILAGLWVAFLAPLATLDRRRARTAATAAVVLSGGLTWFLLGGPKGPMQVLSYRGATGWDVHGTVGATLDALTTMATFVEAGIVRIGYASPVARSAILLAIVLAALVAWWRHRRTDEPAGVALTVTAAILALAPTFPAVWAAWLVPWAAAVADGDRGRATAAWLAVMLTGVVVAIGDDAPATTPWIVIGRGVVLAGVAWAGLRHTTAAEAGS